MTVIAFTTGDILSTHTIETDKNYWRNTQEPPADGRELFDCHICRDSGVTYVSTHHIGGA